MTIQEVEAKLKEINPDLSVRAHDNSDLAGVYWRDIYANIAMPKEDVRMERSEGYVDAWGTPHRGFRQVVERVEAFLKDMEDPEKLAYFTEEFEDHDPEQALIEARQAQANTSVEGAPVVEFRDPTQPIA